MASYGVSTDNPVTKKQWDEREFREVRKSMYIEKFMGQSSDSMIYEKNELLNKQGDKITFTIFPRQSAQIVLGSSGQSIEGKEGKIKSFTDYINLEEYKMAFRWKEGLDAQRPWFSISAESAKGLAQVSSETLDDLWFAAIQDSPSRVIYGGVATSAATLTAVDKITPQLIRRCNALAKTGWANGSNARTTYPFQRIKIGGKKYFVLLVHEYCCYDLKNNAEYQGYVKEAEKRGPDNPIFQDAVAIIDNVIIHEHENMQIKAHPSVAGQYYCTGVLLGAGSSMWAWGKRPETVEKTFGYNEERGIGRKFISMTKKTQFKFTEAGSKEDYGSAGVYVTVTNVATAQ
jgi:N4-gp56 family major capsid protein